MRVNTLFCLFKYFYSSHSLLVSVISVFFRVLYKPSVNSVYLWTLWEINISTRVLYSSLLHCITEFCAQNEFTKWVPLTLFSFSPFYCLSIFLLLSIFSHASLDLRTCLSTFENMPFLRIEGAFLVSRGAFSSTLCVIVWFLVSYMLISSRQLRLSMK